MYMQGTGQGCSAGPDLSSVGNAVSLFLQHSALASRGWSWAISGGDLGHGQHLLLAFPKSGLVYCAPPTPICRGMSN